MFARVVAAVGLGEGVVEFFRARDAARLQHGGLGLDILPRLGKRLVDGARGVADLEPAVPEDVEDFRSEVLLERLGLGGLRLGGEEKHHIDIAPRRKLAAPIAAERHEGHGRGCDAMLLLVGAERVIEKPREQRIDDLGALAANRQAGGAGLVPLAQCGHFRAHEFLAGRQPAGDGGVSGKRKALGGALGDEGGHG